MTFDSTLHIGELIVLAGAGLGVFRGGMGIRDAVRDLTGMVKEMRGDLADHESRIRNLEFGDRRFFDRRNQS